MTARNISSYAHTKKAVTHSSTHWTVLTHSVSRSLLLPLQHHSSREGTRPRGSPHTLSNVQLPVYQPTNSATINYQSQSWVLFQSWCSNLVRYRGIWQREHCISNPLGFLRASLRVGSLPILSTSQQDSLTSPRYELCGCSVCLLHPVIIF